MQYICGTWNTQKRKMNFINLLRFSRRSEISEHIPTARATAVCGDTYFEKRCSAMPFIPKNGSTNIFRRLLSLMLSSQSAKPLLPFVIMVFVTGLLDPECTHNIPS